MRRVTEFDEVIFRALEIANRRHGRACKVAEVIDVLPTSDVRRLNNTHVRGASSAVSQALGRLYRRGEALSPGFSSHGYRFYAASRVFAPQDVTLPDAVSARRRVLAFVHEAVAHLRRPVRAVDVLAYLDAQGIKPGITPRRFSDAMSNLGQTGELQFTAIRGDGRGTKAYLPSEMDAEQYALSAPLTWLEEVKEAFDQIWQERLHEAELEHRLPRPISSTDIRTRLKSAPNPHPHLKDLTCMSAATYNLSMYARPHIRRVVRAGLRAVMWAPVDVPDEGLDVDNNYAFDTERVLRALKRACARHDRPVTSEEVSDEVKRDKALCRKTTYPLATLLVQAAKGTLTYTGGIRQRRVNRFAWRVGQVGNKTYYWYGKAGLREAKAYASLLGLEDLWVTMAAEHRVSELASCRLPTVAIGQAMLLVTELEDFANNLNGLINENALNEAPQSAAEVLSVSVSHLLERARLWLSVRNSGGYKLPSYVATDIRGWTAHDLLVVFKPVYPTAQRAKKAHKLTNALWDKILRVRNPIFTSRFDEDPVAASEYLYDRTDALLFAARQWGSEEAVFQSNLATAELGRVRDARFVLPALKEADFEQRLNAVSCLAFLPATPAVVNALRQTAATDPDPSVRSSADWAHRLVTSEHEELTARLTE